MTFWRCRSHLFPDLTLKRHQYWEIKGTEATGLGYDLVCTQEKGQALFSGYSQKQTALELQISKPKEKKKAVFKMLPKLASELTPAQSILKKPPTALGQGIVLAQQAG